jgi:membrane fusion protein, copper/silver efflux system
MKKAILTLALALTVLSVFIGWHMSRGYGVSETRTGHRIHYMCPMHPQYISDKPGDCPSCGMALVPSETHTAEAPGALNISTEKQQIIGMRIAAVEKIPMDYRIQTYGRVAADETKIVRLTAADGWMEEVYPDAADSVVQKDQLLAKYYSKDFLPVELSFLYTLDAPDRASKERQDRSISYLQSRSADKELRSLGMSDHQIKAIAQTRLPVTDIEVRAPITGFVLSRNISAGMKIEKNAELYRIADLSRVWIMADLYTDDISFLQTGMEADVIMRQQGKTFRARISSVLPQFDPSTRTLKLRLETDNPKYALRPDMFVDVEIPVHKAPTIAVPSEAVLDTGNSRRVFVDLGNGHFTSREVTTGIRFDDKTEILDGLVQGERIVASGTFLIDSESRMRSDSAATNISATGKTSTAKDLVCRMDVDPQKAISVQYGGKVYYFCSEYCKRSFQSHPEKYADDNPAAQNTNGLHIHQ